MIIAVDLDGTLCEEVHYRFFKFAPPIEENINKVNKLKNDGMTIVIYTARMEEDRKITYDWLEENGVEFDELVMGKFRADLYIDKDSIRPEEI